MKTKAEKRKIEFLALNCLELIKCLDDVIASSQRMIEIQEKLVKTYDILIALKKKENLT